MQKSMTYHGETFLEKGDLAETNIKDKIQLKYYTFKEMKDEKNTYGIQVVKRAYNEDGTDTETCRRNNISYSSEKIIEIINTLKDNKVTPIGLNDVLEDLLKAN